jgi:conjugative transfer region protein TrbK
MSDPRAFKALSLCVTACIGTLALAACVIPLRGGESQAPSAASADQAYDPLASKLRECRSVTYEQKDALFECRKAWAEKRRQFLRKETPSSFNSGIPREGPSLFVSPKDESRLSPDYPSIRESGKE